MELIPLDISHSATCRAYKTKILGKWIFVKELNPDHPQDARLEAAFLKEMEIGYQMDHPGLPRYVLTKGILPEGRYVAMEYIDGLTLNEFINKNPRYFADKRNLRRFVEEVSDVLDYLHSRQVLHLDIKPSNVMMTRIGQNAKLIDLGFCHTDTYRDTAGLTPEFKAPERMKEGTEKSASTDYYGLGVLLKFVRENTGGNTGKDFKRLERALLAEDVVARPSDRSEVEKILSGNRNSLKWLTGIVLMLLVSAGIFFILKPMEETGETNLQAHVAMEDTATKETRDTFIEDMEIPGTLQQSYEATVIVPDSPAKETAVQPSGEKTASREKGEIAATTEANENEKTSVSSQDLKEAFVKELKQNITAAYEPIRVRLKKAISEENYTEQEYKAIYDLFNNTVHNLMRSTPTYKRKYPTMDDDYIQDNIAEEMQQAEAKLIINDWNKYSMECLRRRKATGNN